MQVRKQQLELDMEQWTGSKLGKEYIKLYIVPCLFNLYADNIMQNARVHLQQPGIQPEERDSVGDETASQFSWTVYLIQV